MHRDYHRSEYATYEGSGEAPANVLAKPSKFYFTVESTGALRAEKIITMGICFVLVAV